MKDIGDMLNNIMQEENCTPLYAFLLFEKENTDGFPILQPQPTEQSSR